MITKLNDKHPDAVASREADRKLDELRGQLREREEKFGSMETDYTRTTALLRKSRIEMQAAALLDGRAMAVITSDDLERARNECEVLNFTINEQSQLARAAASKVGKQLHELNRSDYIRIEKRIRKAVEELAAANTEEAKFFEELRDAGCASILFRPMAVKSIGSISDHQSGASFFLAEVKKFVPEALA